MNEIKVIPDIEFGNRYENAKHDVLKAMVSIGKLTEGERRQLLAELLNAEIAAMLFQMMCNGM